MMPNNLSNKFLYWTPRILAVLYTVFIFAYFVDIYDKYFSWLRFFGSLMPGILILITTMISWNKKYSKIGGGIFIIIGVFFLIISTLNMSTLAVVVLSLPPIIAGLLFLIPVVRLNFFRQ